MEIEFQNTRKDYIDSSKIILNKRLRKLDITTYILIISLIWFGSTKHYTWIGYLILLFVLIAFIFIIRYLIPLIIGIIKFNRQMSKNDAYLQKRKITISDEGLRTEGENYNLLRNWESIVSSYSDGKFVHITLVDKKTVIIPERFFSSEVAVANFIGLIKFNISKSKYGASQVSDGPKYAPGSDLRQPIVQPAKDPPYLLGLLGIIPFVGVFVGIGLVLYGIIKYKDKWLIIIGAGDILFTVAIYTTLFFYTGSKSQRANFVFAIKPELNSLVKEIEFYKTQEGAYPDSLTQLDKDSNIIDILQEGKKNVHFNYQKIGNKYTLFSSGLDQIPNTADDIYPNLDTAKTGLVISKH